MKIGQVASEAEVTIDTVRFYERRGVLPEPARRPSGFREYPASTVERIRMARMLQNLGYSSSFGLSAAVLAFQSDQGIDETSELDAPTSARLDAVYAELAEL